MNKIEKSYSPKNVLQEDVLYWYWLANVPGMTAGIKNKLLKLFDSPEILFKIESLFLKDFLHQKQLEQFVASRNMSHVMASYQRLKQTNTQFIAQNSASYPQKLKNLYDAPIGLYLRGRLPKEETPSLAIVGSRNATRYGIKMAEYFARELAKNGVQIVSGLAAGIDSAGHRGALEAGGYTLGILGGGIDTIYPRRNFSLYMDMYEHGGVLSESNLGVINQAYLFPLRNRLISAMSDGIFVMEARAKSGSLITVDQGLEQGKDIFAMPGRITDELSIGCNNLIAEGAILVQKPQDICDILWGNKQLHNERQAMMREKVEARYKGEKRIGSSALCYGQQAGFQEESPIGKEKEIGQGALEHRVYRQIDEKTPVSFEQLRKETGLSMMELQHILFSMELKQLIVQVDQNMYLRANDFL